MCKSVSMCRAAPRPATLGPVLLSRRLGRGQSGGSEAVKPAM